MTSSDIRHRSKPRKGVTSDFDDPIDLSRLSKSQRAALDLMIEADADPAMRAFLTGAVGASRDATVLRSAASRRRREIPTTWSAVHVLDRMEEAYAVLAGMPMTTRPKAYGNNMPTVVQEGRLSFLELIQMSESGELELLHDDRNRVRLAPTTAQITRMDQALRWPFEHLRDDPDLARAISLRALWGARGVDARKRCEHLGIDHRQFNTCWHAAVSKIAAALIAGNMPVT